MKKRVLLPVSDGFEEIEACTIIDVLRRAGIDIVTAGLEKGKATGRSGIVMEMDTTIDRLPEDTEWDLVVLPGGLPNAYTLRDDTRVEAILKKQNSGSRMIAAICAAPAALEKAGLLRGRKATNYPALSADLVSADYSESPVVKDKNIITSRGPGTAMKFSLFLVSELAGKDVAEQVAADLLAEV